MSLPDGKIFKVPVRSDGYVNVTLLAKSVGKKIDNWTRLDSTKKILTEFSNSVIYDGVKIIDSIQGKNGGTFYHPDLAILFAQWLSPSFAIQVSRCVRELLLTGSVVLGREKSSAELDMIYEEKRLSLDIQPYLAKDLVYFFEFIPNKDDLEEPELLSDINIHFFEFGVTSNIQKRQSAYGSGYRLDKVFVYQSGFLASLGESYVKKLVIDLKLKLAYKNKIECLRCSYEDLEKIYELMLKHSSYKNEILDKEYEEIVEKPVDDRFEIQKFKLELDYKIEIEKVHSEIEKLKSKQEGMLQLFREGIISFEQFEKCFVNL